MADKATAQEFDVLVLGGGSAGYAAALRSVQYGKSVALVEKSKVGGTCLHWGCIPTKAYLHAAEVADETRNAAKFGVNATLESVDMAKVRDYKDGIVAGKHKGLAGLLKMRKVQVSRARASSSRRTRSRSTAPVTPRRTSCWPPAPWPRPWACPSPRRS